MNAIKRVGAAALLLSITACNDEGIAPSEGEDVVASAEQEIYYGTASGVNFGIVQIAWNGNESKPCSGYFITPRHVVTSAHCTDRRYVSQWYKIYTKTGYNTFAYVRDTQRTDNWVLLSQAAVPGWNFDSPAARYDMAILTLPSSASIGIPNAQNMLRVSTAAPVSGQTNNIWGWGAYAIGPQGMLLPWDLLYGDNVTLKSVYSGYFTATSTGNRLTCVGDSGAPSTRYYNGYYIASGTHRGGEDPRCANPGELMYWSDNSNKISWIETTLRATYGSSFSCARYSSGANAYMKCF